MPYVTHKCSLFILTCGSDCRTMTQKRGNKVGGHIHVDSCRMPHISRSDNILKDDVSRRGAGTETKLTKRIRGGATDLPGTYHNEEADT